jgi:ABC-type sugar transport system substrate-binding protein
MIVKGVDVLVIAAIDGTTLSNALENANAAGINVISYDRLIKNSPYVSYYATFDNFKVGVLQAKSLVNGMEKRGKDPYNVELFGVVLFWNARENKIIVTRNEITNQIVTGFDINIDFGFGGNGA